MLVTKQVSIDFHSIFPWLPAKRFGYQQSLKYVLLLPVLCSNNRRKRQVSKLWLYLLFVYIYIYILLWAISVIIKINQWNAFPLMYCSDSCYFYHFVGLGTVILMYIGSICTSKLCLDKTITDCFPYMFQNFQWEVFAELWIQTITLMSGIWKEDPIAEWVSVKDLLQNKDTRG